MNHNNILLTRFVSQLECIIAWFLRPILSQRNILKRIQAIKITNYITYILIAKHIIITILSLKQGKT